MCSSMAETHQLHKSQTVRSPTRMGSSYEPNAAHIPCPSTTTYCTAAIHLTGESETFFLWWRRSPLLLPVLLLHLFVRLSLASCGQGACQHPNGVGRRGECMQGMLAVFTTVTRTHLQHTAITCTYMQTHVTCPQTNTPQQGTSYVLGSHKDNSAIL